MKAHLVSSDYPIHEGMRTNGNCGEIVHKPKFVFMWDEGILPMLAYPRMVCRDCAAAEIKGRYIYGVTEQP